ncbi:hypothetical protein KEM54_004072 [Ascosphaera aggregata]|nr:hypothetical protein KEM54_004072 [Ascosphaera aggregata]
MQFHGSKHLLSSVICLEEMKGLPLAVRGKFNYYSTFRIEVHGQYQSLGYYGATTYTVVSIASQQENPVFFGKKQLAAPLGNGVPKPASKLASAKGHGGNRFSSGSKTGKMPFREKFKALFYLKERYRSYKRKEDTRRANEAPLRSRRPAIKVPKVKPYKPKYDKNGKPIPELFKPHEIPRSKYRGPVDQAHMDNLAAYSFRLAQRERPRSAVSSISPTATRLETGRSSFSLDQEEPDDRHQAAAAAAAEEEEEEEEGKEGEEESHHELSRPFSQPALDVFLRNELSSSCSFTDEIGLNGETSRPVSSPTFGTRDKMNVLSDTDIISYNTSATSFTAHMTENGYFCRGSSQITSEDEKIHISLKGMSRRSEETQESWLDQRRMTKRPGSVIPDVITRGTALRANPLHASAIF